MEFKTTITSIFIVPTLSINRTTLQDVGFVQGYIGDVRQDIQHKNAVYLLFKPKNLDSFRSFLENEHSLKKEIIDDYDYEDGYVVVVYKLNKKFKSDFDLIKEGKYSKTSENFQKIFPKVIKMVRNGLNKDMISLQYRVFNKTEDLKRFWEDKIDIDFEDSWELWEGFDEGLEMLDLDKQLKEELICKD